MQKLCTIDETKELIKADKILLLAGTPENLNALPEGRWIGGSIPYFMAPGGGIMETKMIFVTEIPGIHKGKLMTYGEDTIQNIYSDAPENGISFVIIPGGSPIHLNFALNASKYDDFAAKPLTGWISGVHVDKIGVENPVVIFGANKKVLENKAVVFHAELPENTYADINIINIFQQGDGDTITFEEDGFSAQTALINGEKQNFADYVNSNGIDTKLPLVANYAGAMINTSFQGIDEDTKTVNFYAPVFQGIEYRIAAPVSDYIEEFKKVLSEQQPENVVFSCNCILNYLYAELEGKETGSIHGPITFGEIAFQLLNQTLTYVTINKV